MISCFNGFLLGYFMNDFEKDPVVPINNGVTSVFAFHTLCIANVKVFIFLNFLEFFLDHIPVS